jgi:hypothetical protein
LFLQNEDESLIKLSYPILIYDDSCYSCTRYAQIVNNLVPDKCMIVGHYTPMGKEIKKNLFPKDYDGLEMSWFIIDGHAYGGRAGLFRLIRYLLLERKKGTFPKNEFHLTGCIDDCKAVRGVFSRLHSIIVKNKKFNIIN